MTTTSEPEKQAAPADAPKKAWSAPSIEVVPVGDTDGPVGGSPVDDGLSGHS